MRGLQRDRGLVGCAVALVGLVFGGCGTGGGPEMSSGNADMRADAGNTDTPGSTSNVCEAERELFVREIWEPILSTKCIGCHNADGQAAGSRMVLQPDSQSGSREHNFQQVTEVATTSVGDKPLLLAMPSDTNPERAHPGGEVLPADGVEYDRLKTFVMRVRSDGCDGSASDPSPDCSRPQPGPRQLRRLTPEQYDNTVRDLVGIEGTWGQSFPADPVVHGFDNHAAELRVSPSLAGKLQVAAEDIAEQADLATLLPCTPSEGTDACARRFIRTFGKRAFRRPLTDADVDRYATLYDAADTLEGGTRLIIAAMLQSPHFLYRSELGKPAGEGTYTLSDYEIASELSYLIWDTMPDAELFAAAKVGELHTAMQIAERARRMLASQKARPVFRRFVFEWLGLDTLRTVPKDAATFPELSNDVRRAMIEEAERLVDYVIYEGTGKLPELITAELGFVDPTLADFYGVRSEGDRMHRVAMPRRSGLLTQGGVMFTHARSNDSSPVHRGKLVRERFFCQTPPPPPPGINAEPPPLDPELTPRERYSAHSRQEPCKSCHRLMDPIGFAFSQFDGVGRYRDSRSDLDLSGEIVSTPQTNTTFEGTEELAQILAESSDVHDCFARQWVRYGYGLSESPQTRCTLQRVQQAFGERDLSIRGLVIALTQTAHFTRRRASSTRAPSDEPAGVADAGQSSGNAGTGSDASTIPDGGSDGARTSDGGGPRMSPDPDQELMRVKENEWQTGYCHTYEVTNTGSDTLAWSVTLDLMGTLTNSWESTVDGNSDTVTFTGATHNDTLEPGASARFGFCVER